MKFTEKKHYYFFTHVAGCLSPLVHQTLARYFCLYKLNFCCYNCADITSTFIVVYVLYRTFIYTFIADLIC